MTPSSRLSDHDRARLSAYVDNELDAEARAEVDAWLQRSPEARAVLADMRRLDASLRSVPVPDPGSEYWQRFADRVAVRLAPGAASASFYERMTAWLFRGGRVAWLRAGGAIAMLTLIALVATRGTHAPAPGGLQRGNEPRASAPAPAPPDVTARAELGAEAGLPGAAVFVNAALDGDRDAALAALAELERAQPGTPELVSMRAWVDATAPVGAQAKQAERQPAERAAAEALAQSEATRMPLPALQALDALVWPRRVADAAAVERLAVQLEGLAHADPAARGLAERYLAWLAASSPDSAAARAYQARLRGIGG